MITASLARSAFLSVTRKIAPTSPDAAPATSERMASTSKPTNRALRSVVNSGSRLCGFYQEHHRGVASATPMREVSSPVVKASAAVLVSNCACALRLRIMALMFPSLFRPPIRGRCSLLLMGVGLGEDSCPKVFDRSRLSLGSGGVEPPTGSRTEKESSARRQNCDARASARSWVRRPKV